VGIGHLACVLAVLACGVGPPETPETLEARRVLARLVDRGEETPAPEPATLVVRDARAFPSQTSSTARLPTATIDDETRYVLASHESSILKFLEPTRLDERGRLRLSIDLWFELLAAPEIVVAPVLRAEDGGWRELPVRRLPVQRLEKRRVVELDEAVPGVAPGSAVEVTVFAHRPPGRPTTRVRTEPLQIPERAQLEFGFGVLEAARAAGPLEFRIESCEAEACSEVFAETLDPGTQAGRGWQHRRVSLPASTTPRELRFVTSRGAEQAFSLPVWSNPLVTAPVSGARPPSFVIVSIDTLRRDHLDVYGYERETAPFLRSLMQERGVVFENLLAESATTDPSHMSLFTSLPALVHGVQRKQEALQVPVATLAELLRQHGYRTAAFTENGPLARERGFGLGFETYAENKSIDLVLPTGHVEKTLAQGRRWLEQQRELPFLLFLHTFQVHAPYAPPDHLKRHFSDEPTRPVSLPDPEQRGRRGPLVDDYDREIRFVDEQLEALLAWAEQAGADQNTWWIFLSDHGEEFFEHGELGHRTLPYEEVLRVPLLVAGPTDHPGTRDASPLHHVDVMPTVLELAGVARPAGLAGESFASRLRGAPEIVAERPRFATTWMLPDGLEAPAHSVQRGLRKLIRYREGARERQLLFDLGSEAGEAQDLTDEEAGEVAALATLLDAHLSEAEEARAHRAPAGLAPGEPIPLDPEREEKLRALGYLE
jgi:arylsulfatase A-like enzyme